MKIKFKEYEAINQKQKNEGFSKKLSKLGFSLDSSLSQISSLQMTTFLNANYYHILPVIPAASCSLVAGNNNLISQLSKEFGIKTSTVYGYIKTENKFFHKFNDSDINSAIQQKQYFENHHAWIMFENGQLLDLTFVNTLKMARNVDQDIYEFILADGDNVSVPVCLDILGIGKKTYFNYIPMYLGKLFSDELLFSVSPKKLFF